MWLLYISAALIILICDYFIAKQFSNIAEMKGHHGNTYFKFTFIFGIIGMLMVVALPDLSKKPAPAERPTAMPAVRTEQQTVASGKIEKNTSAHTAAAHSWRCNHCGNMTSHTPCEHCGQ